MPTIAKFLIAILIAIPEFLMIILTGLAIERGNVFIKLNTTQEKLQFAFKMIISMLVMASVVYVKKLIGSFLIGLIIAIVVAILIFKIIWFMDYKTSLICTFITITIQFLLDDIGYLLVLIIGKINNPIDLNSNRLIYSFILRIIHLIILLKIYKLDMSNSKQLLRIKWNNLNNKMQKNIIMVIALCFMSMICSIMFMSIVTKNKIEITSPYSIYYELITMLVVSIIFIILAIWMLIRTRRYDFYEEFVNSDPEVIFDMLIQIANEEQLLKYADMLITALEIKTLLELQKNLKILSMRFNNFTYYVDEELRDFKYNYTTLLNFVETMCKLENNRDINIDFYFSRNSLIVSIDVDNIDELQYNRLLNEKELKVIVKLLVYLDIEKIYDPDLHKGIIIFKQKEIKS